MKLYEIYQSHPLVCTDSRICPSGSLFFALKGDNFDGNVFALSALEKGASYAVVDNPEYAVDERFILVEDTLQTLQDLAREHRKRLGTKIIGITGTNGKTTTKELIAAVLKQQFNTHYTQGNFNNHIGVPLTLLQLKPEHEIAVVEMGANHPGEIKVLSDIALPDYGIITNVGTAHLEGFGSFEGVKKTKAELYDFIYKNSGKIFINTGNEHLVKMAEKAGFTDESRMLPYQINAELCNKLAVGNNIESSPTLQMTLETAEGKFETKTQLIGAYNAENVSASAAVGTYFNISNEKIKSALENYQPQNNRSQFMQTEKNKLIVDAYNANPTSMQVAVLNFASMNVPNKTLILGDMLELGSQSSIEHQKIINLIAEKGFTDVFLIGKCFQKVKSKFINFADVNELVQFLQEKPLENRFILIKGSHGIRLEKIIGEL